MTIQTRRQAAEEAANEEAPRIPINNSSSTSTSNSALNQIRRSISSLFTSSQNITETSTDTTETHRSNEMEPQRTNTAPAPKAPTYDGTTDVDVFIWAYTDYGTYLRRTPEESLQTLPFSLIGNARDVYYQRWAGHIPPSFEDALASLQEAFGIAKRPENDFSGLLAITQKVEETITDYTQRFGKEQSLISGTVPDGILRAAFVKGLTYKIESEVQKHYPTTYPQAVAAAREAERQVLHKQAKKAEEMKQTKSAMITAKSPVQNQLPQRPPWIRPNPYYQMGGGGAIGTAGPTAPRPQYTPQTYGSPRPFVPNFRPWQNRPLSGLPIGTAKIPSGDPEAQDKEVNELRKQLEGLTIGSAQYEQLKQTVRTQGRCLNCFSRTHFASQCPHKTYQTRAVWTTGPALGFKYARACEEAEQRQKQWEEENPIGTPDRDQWEKEVEWVQQHGTQYPGDNMEEQDPESAQ